MSVRDRLRVVAHDRLTWLTLALWLPWAAYAGWRFRADPGEAAVNVACTLPLVLWLITWPAYRVRRGYRARRGR